MWRLWFGIEEECFKKAKSLQLSSLQFFRNISHSFEVNVCKTNLGIEHISIFCPFIKNHSQNFSHPSHDYFIQLQNWFTKLFPLKTSRNTSDLLDHSDHLMRSMHAMWMCFILFLTVFRCASCRSASIFTIHSRLNQIIIADNWMDVCANATTPVIQKVPNVLDNQFDGHWK